MAAFPPASVRILAAAAMGALAAGGASPAQADVIHLTVAVAGNVNDAPCRSRDLHKYSVKNTLLMEFIKERHNLSSGVEQISLPDQRDVLPACLFDQRVLDSEPKYYSRSIQAASSRDVGPEDNDGPPESHAGTNPAPAMLSGAETPDTPMAPGGDADPISLGITPVLVIPAGSFVYRTISSAAVPTATPAFDVQGTPAPVGGRILSITTPGGARLDVDASKAQAEPVATEAVPAVSGSPEIPVARRPILVPPGDPAGADGSAPRPNFVFKVRESQDSEGPGTSPPDSDFGTRVATEATPSGDGATAFRPAEEVTVDTLLTTMPWRPWRARPHR